MTGKIIAYPQSQESPEPFQEHTPSFRIFISDLHGNIENIQAFAKAVRGFDYDNIVCLGDIIHKGDHYDESRTIDALKKLQATAVRGNHDSTDLSELSKIPLHHQKYLASLPKHIEESPFVYFHTSLSSPGTRLRSDELKLQESRFIKEHHNGVRIGVYGHTHEPHVFEYDPLKQRGASLDISQKVFFDPQKTYLANPGTLGAARQTNTLGIYGHQDHSWNIMTLEELKDLHLNRILLDCFESEWMPKLTGEDPSYRNLDNVIAQLENLSFNIHTADLLRIMKGFCATTKKEYAEFSLQLAQSLQGCATDDVLAFYDVCDPLQTREYYLTHNRSLT